VLDYALDRVQIRHFWWLVVLFLGPMLGTAAVVKPTIALAVVLGGVFIALAMVDLAAGVAAFALLTFFERFPGIPASELSVVKAAGLTLIICWLAHMAAGQDAMPLLPRTNSIIAYAGAVLVVIGFASVLWAADAGVARTNALRLVQGPILLLIVFSAVQTSRHFRWVLWAYFAGAVATAVVGIGKTPADAADVGRLSGGIRDPNELAAALLPAIPIGLFALAIVRDRLARWALTVGLLVILASLFMTGSRGGLIGLGTMAIAAIILAGPLRQQVVFGVLMTTGVAVAYYTLFAPPAVLWRLTNFTAEGGSGRTDLWSVAMAMFRDHPLLGVGAGNFQVLEPSYALSSINLSDVQFIVDAPRWVHNTYLHVLVELGIVGFICFSVVVIGSLISGFKSLRRVARTAERDTEILARGFLIGVIGMLTAFVFLTAQYEKELWLLLGLTLALRTVSRTHEPVREGSLALVSVTD
jgi:O-antigen ligase